MPTDPEQIVEMIEQIGAAAGEHRRGDQDRTEMSSGVTGIDLSGFFILAATPRIFSTIGGLIGGAVFKVAADRPHRPPPRRRRRRDAAE